VRHGDTRHVRSASGKETLGEGGARATRQHGSKEVVLPPDAHTLENTIGYTFSDRALLQMALTHRSYVFETPGVPNITNERLEFLGDSVITYTTAEHLYRTYPDLTEGELTEVRAALIKEPTLAGFARQIGLGPALLLGKGEEISGGRDRNRLIASAFEALVGALLLDSGIDRARTLILSMIIPEAKRFVETRRYKDEKLAFQELAQRRLGITPVYVVIGEEGPSHQRIFTVEVRVGELVAGIGTGTSKQRAERDAACDALSRDGWRSESE
jgi:ribonuclease III